MCCYLTKKCPEKLSHEVSSYLCYKIMFSYPLFGIISETQSYKIDIKELSLRGKSVIAKRKRKNSINKHFPQIIVVKINLIKLSTINRAIKKNYLQIINDQKTVQLKQNFLSDSRLVGLRASNHKAHHELLILSCIAQFRRTRNYQSNDAQPLFTKKQSKCMFLFIRQKKCYTLVKELKIKDEKSLQWCKRDVFFIVSQQFLVKKAPFSKEDLKKNLNTCGMQAEYVWYQPYGDVRNLQSLLQAENWRYLCIVFYWICTKLESPQSLLVQKRNLDKTYLYRIYDEHMKGLEDENKKEKQQNEGQTINLKWNHYSDSNNQ